MASTSQWNEHLTVGNVMVGARFINTSKRSPD
jgi:hypothetical protein